MVILSHRFSTLRRWTSLSGQVAGLQIVVQGINAVTGLLLVRHLPKDQYAWLTIAGSLLATLNLLGDGGISTGLTAIGGRIYDQHGPFARLLRDGLHLALHLAIFGFLLSAPFFYVLYANVGSPPTMALTAIVLAGLAVWPSVSIVFLNVANRLHKRVRLMQMAELTGALTRLGLTSAVLLSGWLAMLPALAATVLSSWAQALVVKRRTRVFLLEPDEATSFQPQLRGYVRSLYGNHVFFCLQGQIATWIIGWLAGSSEVADLGALGRLSVLFTAFTAPFHYLAIPAIARIREVQSLRLRVAMTLVIAALIAGSVVMVAWWQPAPFLWILGSNYTHLTVELPLALSAQGLTMVAALAWGLILARGWVHRAWMTILTTVCGMVIGAALFRLDTVAGMLSFSLVSVLPTFVVCLVIIIFKLKSDSSLSARHS